MPHLGFSRFLAVPVLLVCALTAHADTAMTKITVHVTNDSGKPVDRAAVVIRFVQGRSVVKLGKKIRTTYELRTNQDGEATIPEIPQGKILVQVHAANYQTFGETFDIGEEQKTVEIKLNPPQQQYSAHEPLKQ